MQEESLFDLLQLYHAVVCVASYVGYY